MIFKGSRYQNTGVYQVTDATGRTTTALQTRFIPPTPAGYYHTVTADQRLDLIAYRFYQDAEKFWLIADANPEMDAEDLLQPGRQILIRLTARSALGRRSLMAAKTYRLLFGGDAVDEGFYGDVVSLTVEESTVAAGAFSLRLISRRQSDGAWGYLDDARLSLFNDVSIQVGFSDGPGASLSTVFDGYVTGLKVSLSADPDSSFVEVEGMDPSVLMSVEEKISTWPNLADSDIAQHIVGGYDLPVTVDDTPTQHLEDDTTVVQRGTDLDFVRMLARRNGLEFYFEAESPGTPAAYFRAPQLQGTPQPDLVVQLADDTNLKNFAAQLSGLRPLNVKTEQMDVQANSANSATVSDMSLEKLGARDAASLLTGTLGALVQPKDVLAQTLVLGPPTSDATELQTLAQAVRDEAAWLIHAAGEINSEAYQNVLRPRRTVLVRGAGQTFNGTYYVTRVTHEIKADGDYSQSFEARRNALGADGTELFGGNGTRLPAPGF